VSKSPDSWRSRLSASQGRVNPPFIVKSINRKPYETARTKTQKTGPETFNLLLRHHPPPRSTASRMMRNLSRQACPDIAKKTASPKETQSYLSGPALAQQLQDQLGVGIRYAKRLNAQLLLDLQCGELRRSFIHIGIDERTDARRERIAQIGDIVLLSREISRRGTEDTRCCRDIADRCLDVGR
jgi:hypothetical protein